MFINNIKKLAIFIVITVLLGAPMGGVYAESVRERLNKDVLWQEIKGDWMVVDQTPSPLLYAKKLYHSLGMDSSEVDEFSVSDEQQYVSFRNEKIYFFTESDFGSGSLKVPIMGVDGQRLILTDKKMVAAYDQGKTNIELSEGMNYLPLFYEVSFKDDQLVLTSNRIEQLDGPLIYYLEKIE